MILDPDTGEVQIRGPKTKEQKARLDEALRRRTEAQEEVTYFAAKYRKTRDERKRRNGSRNGTTSNACSTSSTTFCPNVTRQSWKTGRIVKAHHAPGEAALGLINIGVKHGCLAVSQRKKSMFLGCVLQDTVRGTCPTYFREKRTPIPNVGAQIRNVHSNGYARGPIKRSRDGFWHCSAKE